MTRRGYNLITLTSRGRTEVKDQKLQGDRSCGWRSNQTPSCQVCVLFLCYWTPWNEWFFRYWKRGMLFMVWFHLTFNGDILFQEMLGALSPEVYLDS